MIDATTGHHLWADRYDRDLDDIFALQDEITMKILTALQVELTEGQQARVYGKGTNNFEAYIKFLQARKAAAGLLRLFPSFSLEWDHKYSYYKNPSDLEKQHEDLRAAGLE